MKMIPNIRVLLLIIFSIVCSADYVNITNCPSNFSDDSFVPSRTVTIMPEWTASDEKHLVYNYNWTYRMTHLASNGKNLVVKTTNWLVYMQNYTYKLVIPKYQLSPGQYIVNVTSKRKPDVVTGPVNALEKGFVTCHIDMFGFPPIVIITGGFERMVPPDTPIYISGEESSDPLRPNSNDTLKFIWKCTQKLPTTFCKKDILSTKSKFTIPARFVKAGDEFKILLTVRLTYGDELIKNIGYQNILVVNNAATIMLGCKKNCRPVTDRSDYQQLTFIEVVCRQNCEDIKSEHYQWTVKHLTSPKDEFDFSKSRFGNEGTKLIIEKDAFKPGDYLISVTLSTPDGKKGLASLKIFFGKPPVVKDCKLIPDTGDSLKTYFRFNCVQTPEKEENYYELYARDKNDPSQEQLIVDGTYPEVQNRSFTLPVSDGKEFIIRAIKGNNPYVELPVHAQVVSGLENTVEKETVQILKQLYRGETSEESISKMISSEKPEQRNKAIQIFQALVNELVIRKIDNSELADFVEYLKYAAAEDMLKAPVTSINEVLKLSESLTKLQGVNASAESDPLLAKFTTTVCRKMVDRSLEMLKQERYPLNMADKTQKLSKTISRCLQSNSYPNYGILKPIRFNVTTRAPFLDVAMLTENYADYVDHNDEYYQKLDYLREVSYNTMNTSATAAKLTALTTATGEGLIRNFGKREETLIFKDTGTEMAKQKFQAEGVTIYPSEDFEDDDHSYDFLMTAWKEDILWWNPTHTEIPTCIINCEFWHSTCTLRIKEFKKPANIYFDLKNTSTFDANIFENSFIFKGHDGDLNYKIIVHRVALPKTRMLRIKFDNLTSHETFDVVLTEFKFPTIEDFAHSVTVKAGSNHFLNLLNKYDYDIYVYVGILVNKEVAVNEGTTVYYRMKFFASTCVQWLTSSSKWVPTCKPGNQSSDSTVHCECNHFSILAGFLENIDSPLQQVMKPDLKLELVSSRIIFITVASTFGIFFLLLLVVLFKKKEKIYFLSDNEMDHRYAYLVIVRTGTGFKSGTTSNVVIKVNGATHSSKPHVLNYPDPRLRLLQNFGRDHFLLTTKYYLGEILSLELWFDGLGSNHTWYCRDITIYDMQNGTKWYFNIKTEMSVVKEITHLLANVVTAGERFTPQIQSKTTSKGDGGGDKPVPKLDKPDRKFQHHFAQFSNFLSKFKIKPEVFFSSHSWFFTLTLESFSYLKKLMVVFSTILTTYALALVFIGTPRLQLRDGFDVYQEYRIDSYAIFVAFGSSFISFSTHSGIAWGFRCSKLQFSRYDQSSKFSFTYTITCWIILIGLITLSNTFLIIFGFWVPLNTSLVWLTSSIMGIIFGAFAYETLFLYIQKCFLNLDIKFDIRQKFNEIHKKVEAQRKYLYEHFGQSLLRPYFGHLYSPLSQDEVKARQIALDQRRYAITEFEDLIMFGIYFIILYIVVLANKGDLIIKGKTAIETILKGASTRTLSFKTVETGQKIYVYLNETLIPSIQPSVWYHNYTISEPGLMVDMCTKYMGVVRLRQHRTKRDFCYAAKIMRFLNLTCQPEYSLFNGETKTFGDRWGALSSYFAFDRLRKIWQYSSRVQTQTLDIAGEIAAYSGGGYVAYLGRTLYNSCANFHRLLEKSWINENTRVIFVEFLTYNANFNIFNSITLTFEHSTTGLMYNNAYVYVARMLFVENEVEKMSMTFFVLFIIWVGMMFFKYSIGVFKNFRTFYKDLWFMIDIIILFLSIMCISLYTVRMYFIKKYLEALERSKHNDFLSYFYLFYMEDFLTFVAATLVCIATIRLWKFLRFAIIFRTLEKTLTRAAAPLVMFSIVFVIVLLGCGLTLFTFFGSDFERTHSWIKMTKLVMTLPLSAPELKTKEFLSYKGPAFFVAVTMILLEMCLFCFIIIIVRSYMDSQMDFSAEFETYSIKNYVQERLKYFPKFLKYGIFFKYRRLRAGVDGIKVKPKSDKFLYSNSFSLPVERMTFMRYITKCVIRNCVRYEGKSRLSAYDVNLILGLCRQFLFKRTSYEVDVFYRGRIQGRNIKIVDERRIERIANVVNLILQKDSPAVFIRVDRGVPTFKKYTRIIKKNQATLEKCTLRLTVVLNKMNSVELEVSKQVSSLS